MAISVNPVSQVQYTHNAPVKSPEKKDSGKKSISSKVVLSTLAAAGLATLAAVCLKSKNKKKPDIKKLTDKVIKVKDMTLEEKEKFIKTILKWMSAYLSEIGVLLVVSQISVLLIWLLIQLLI